jgi:hypothetical protein
MVTIRGLDACQLVAKDVTRSDALLDKVPLGGVTVGSKPAGCMTSAAPAGCTRTLA